jgi:hypothetical protein
MVIKDEKQLKETLKLVNDNLQAIQEYVVQNNSCSYKVRFPRGVIRTAHSFRERLKFVTDETLRQNLSYALMLHDVQNWILVRTDLSDIAREMLIKDSIVLIGNIAETLTRLPLSKSAQSKSYVKRTEQLESKAVITAVLQNDLDWLWETRCNCHFFLVEMREYGRYKTADYTRAVRTLRDFRDALDVYYLKLPRSA